MGSALRLDEDAAALLESEASRRGVAPSDLARDAIVAYLSGQRRRLGFIAAGESTSGFRARQADEVLRAEFGSPPS